MKTCQPYVQTVEWWDRVCSVSGKRHADMGPRDLQDAHGDVTASSWANRRYRARDTFTAISFGVVARGGANSRLYSPIVSDVDAGDIADGVRRLLKRKRHTLEELCDALSCPPKDVRDALETLDNSHILLEQFGERLAIGDNIPVKAPLRIDVSKYAETIVPIGVIADMHYCSKYCREDVVDALYDRFAAEGVTDVYVPGNWIDGEARFNKQDILIHGVDNQVRYFIEHLPRRDGITTHVLSGDDHEGWYVQREGLNIGNRLEHMAQDMGRDDITDLGYMERDISLDQDDGSAILRVAHMGGGSSYATSYTAQKYVEALQGGEKPKIVLAGHYHKYDVSYPREVHVIQPGCCQDQTPFMRKRKIQAHVGGVILKVRQNTQGVITSLQHEWFPFYDKAFYAFQW